MSLFVTFGIKNVIFCDVFYSPVSFHDSIASGPEMPLFMTFGTKNVIFCDISYSPPSKFDFIAPGP